MELIFIMIFLLVILRLPQAEELKLFTSNGGTFGDTGHSLILNFEGSGGTVNLGDNPWCREFRKSNYRIRPHLDWFNI